MLISHSPANDARINARLSGEDAARFQKLLEKSGLSTSQLLRAALREYEANHQPPGNAMDLLAGFIGSGEGPEDLSASYKDYLSKSLENKWAQEPHAADR